MTFFFRDYTLSIAALGMVDQITQAQAQSIANAMQEAMHRQMEEALFGGRAMPTQVAVTENLILGRRKPSKHPFGIINFEDVSP